MIKFKKHNLQFLGNYRGIVVSNTDSSMLGRIKVEVYGVFDGIDADDIPWAIPALPISSGAGSGFGSFAVPEVGSLVWCFFEQGSLYQPVYFAEATDGIHGLPAERTTNYPSRKVIKTKNGIAIYIDDSTGSQEIKISHPGGASLTIDDSGNITIAGTAIVIEGTTVSINP